MKTEKYILTALCAVVFIWVIKMVVGIIGLARYQGPSQLLALIEVAAFMGAGVIPLLAAWLSSPQKKWLYVLWAPCILYVCFLAIRYTIHNPIPGAIRLLLWIAIIALVARSTHSEKSA